MRKRTTLALALSMLATACDPADCVRHSDCANSLMCMDGECIDPNADTDTDTTGQPPTTTGPSTSCPGYTFEALDFTITKWECDPIESPIDAPPFPLDPLTMTPLYTAVSIDEAASLYDVGVCEGGGSPYTDWDTARLGFAESIYQQCRMYIDTHPICENLDDVAAEGLCTDIAAAYYITIGSVPKLEQIPGILVSEPCSDVAPLSCGGAADGGSGG